MKTSFKTRVSRMGLGSFVDINIFVMIYYFIWFLHILHFFRIASIKIHTNVKTPKRKLGSFVQRYSFKFWALEYLFVQCTAHTGVFICTVYCTQWSIYLYSVLHALSPKLKTWYRYENQF